MNTAFAYFSALFSRLRTSSARIRPCSLGSCDPMLALNLSEAVNSLLHTLDMVFLPDKVMLSLRSVQYPSRFHPCNLATCFSTAGFGFAGVLYGA